LKDAKDAIENGVPCVDKDNRIYSAYQLRCNPAKEVITAVEEDQSGTSDEVNIDQSSERVTVLTLGNEECEVLPSNLLGDDGWLETTRGLFNVDNLVAELIVTPEMKEKGDLLCKILRSRMSTLTKRINDAEKRSHWALKLAFKNLAAVAAYMVMVDHVKSDLSCLDESQPLLSHHCNKFLLCTSFPLREGAYLYYDTNRGEFVRSGKVSGRGFGVRHTEHARESKKRNKTNSTFYFEYPSQSIADGRRTQGKFELLQQYIAAGYDPSSDSAAAADKKYNAGGFLIIDDDDIKQIDSSQKRTQVKLHKYQAYIAYLMEFGYDLAIRPSLNVSQNPGFESLVGVFDCGNDDT
jgi:hypothetical protein